MSHMRTAEEVWRTPDASPCELLLIDDHTRPVLGAAVVLPTGCLWDPPGKEGLAYLTGQMLTRGAGDMSREAIADEVDFLGATLSATVGRKSMTVSGDVLSRNLDAYQGLVARVVAEPTFPAEELEKLKRLTIAEIRQVIDNDAALGNRHYARALFTDHPYGRPLKGTPETVAAITRDDVVAFYRQHVRSQSAFVAAAGDVTEARLADFASATVGRLESGGSPPLVVPPPRAIEQSQVVLVDKPERTQTQVFIGHLSVHSRHPDYTALHIANTYFGGTFTSKLTQEIREKRGWSYSAYSALSTDRHLGSLTLRFGPAVKDTLPAIQLARDLLQEFKDKGPSDDDIAFAKGYLVKSHPFSIDTPGRQLNERLMARLQGRPDRFVDEYMASVEAVDADAVREAVAKHIHPDRMVVAVVCTADDLREPMASWDALSGADAVKTVAYDSQPGGN